ncbi:hypothetical protein BgiBS90_003387, partial [Biomphalaria glabrata]
MRAQPVTYRTFDRLDKRQVVAMKPPPSLVNITLRQEIFIISLSGPSFEKQLNVHLLDLGVRT